MTKPVETIPQLRFPEFYEPWEENKLGEIASFSKGKGISKSDVVAKGKYPCIRYGELYTTYNETIDKIVSYTNLSPDILVLSIANDIIIPTSGETSIDIAKASCILLDNVALGGDINIIRGDFNGIFLAYFLNSSLKYDIAQLAQGNSVVHLYASQLQALNVYLPSLSEQQKIANFLRSVDAKVEKLEAKKDALERYKKGMMQKIFNQEIRFTQDDGTSFPDWEEKKLGNIGNAFDGLVGKTRDDFGRGLPYIQYKQIFDNSKINILEMALVDIADNEKQAKVQYGDVFFTKSSETPDEIGVSSVLLEECEEAYLNSFCFGYRVNSQEELSSEFARFLFRSQHARDKVIPLAQGSTRFNMSKLEFLKLTLLIPSLSEQQKIADFLSAIDQKIETVEQKIQQTRLFKKSLMQKMFV